MIEGSRPWLSVVVPAHNEAGRLTPGLARLRDYARRTGRQIEVIVADDGSTDGTAEVAGQFDAAPLTVRVLGEGRRRGKGHAVRRGVLAAAGALVLVADADGSTPIDEVEKLAAWIDRGDDVAIGSRYIGGIRILNWSLGRLALSLFANVYVRTILGLRVHDATSGFRGYRAQALRDLLDKPPSSTGYSFLVECLYLLLVAGHRIEEVPIIYHERRVGQSKMSSGVITEAVWRPIALRAKFLLRRR